MTSRPAQVRIFRHGRGELCIEFEGRRLDLSDYFDRNGIPADLIDRFAEGWFTRAELLPRLREDEWRETVLATPLKTPLPPRVVGKILCLGKNFSAHAAEFDEEVPDEPLFFNKLPETLVAHGATVRVSPAYTRRVDHEAELAVVIARNGSNVPEEHALDWVAGYTVANDLTARSTQGYDRKRQFPWFRSKNMDGFCPLGPCLVPRDFLDLDDLAVTAHVNGEERQRASTRDMVVSVPRAIAYLSTQLTLRSGDLILMGTPAGVGPLEDGDVVTCAVESIGELETRISRPVSSALDQNTSRDSD